MNLNKVFLIGNLTRDPELRTTPSGQPVASFGLATNRVYTDKSGQKQKQTEFHNIVAWGRLAEIANQYLNKGKSVFIEGRLNTRNWEAQDGSKRYRTEIIAETLQLGPRFSGAPAESAGTTETAVAPPAKEEEIPVIQQDEEAPKDDIPF
jgi:single-strand DNA-binding protein